VRSKYVGCVGLCPTPKTHNIIVKYVNIFIENIFLQEKLITDIVGPIISYVT